MRMMMTDLKWKFRIIGVILVSHNYTDSWINWADLCVLEYTVVEVTNMLAHYNDISSKH